MTLPPGLLHRLKQLGYQPVDLTSSDWEAGGHVWVPMISTCQACARCSLKDAAMVSTTFNKDLQPSCILEEVDLNAQPWKLASPAIPILGKTTLKKLWCPGLPSPGPHAELLYRHLTLEIEYFSTSSPAMLHLRRDDFGARLTAKEPKNRRYDQLCRPELMW